MNRPSPFAPATSLTFRPSAGSSSKSRTETARAPEARATASRLALGASVVRLNQLERRARVRRCHELFTSGDVAQQA